MLRLHNLWDNKGDGAFAQVMWRFFRVRLSLTRVQVFHFSLGNSFIVRILVRAFVSMCAHIRPGIQNTDINTDCTNLMSSKSRRKKLRENIFP